MLTLEIQNYTPQEMNRILEDVKQEMRDFTTYRVYEVTRNSLRNTDDLAELPIVVANLGKKITEETLNVQTSGYSVASFAKSPSIKEEMEKLKGAKTGKEAYVRIKGPIPEPFKLGLPSFPKTTALPSTSGWGFSLNKEEEGEEAVKVPEKEQESQPL